MDHQNHESAIKNRLTSYVVSTSRLLADDPAYALIAVSALLFASGYIIKSQLQTADPSTLTLVLVLGYVFGVVSLWVWTFLRVIRRYLL